MKKGVNYVIMSDSEPGAIIKIFAFCKHRGQRSNLNIVTKDINAAALDSHILSNLLTLKALLLTITMALGR